MDDQTPVALEAAAAGFAVFPCRSATWIYTDPQTDEPYPSLNPFEQVKAPLTKKCLLDSAFPDQTAEWTGGERVTWRAAVPEWLHGDDDSKPAGGFRRAVIQPAHVAALFGQWAKLAPMPAIAIPPDRCVVDVDPDKDGNIRFPADLLEALQRESNLVVKTPSGGLHIHFAAIEGFDRQWHLYIADDDGSVVRVADFKAGARGYVYPPGATSEKGRYEAVKGSLSDPPAAVPPSLRSALLAMYAGSPQMFGKVHEGKGEKRPRCGPGDLRCMTPGTPGGRHGVMNRGVFTDAWLDQLTPEREKEWRAAAGAAGMDPSAADDCFSRAKADGETKRKTKPPTGEPGPAPDGGGSARSYGKPKPGEGFDRRGALAALPDDLRALIASFEGAPLKRRVPAARAVRGSSAWLGAAPDKRSIARHLLTTFELRQTSEDGAAGDVENEWERIPEGLRIAVEGLLGRNDGGQWTDPEDAPEQEPDPFKTDSEWDEKPPERQWLIRDWLPRGRLGLFAGVGGYGKSRMALQIAARVAADRRGKDPEHEADAIPGHVVTPAFRIDPDNAGPVVFASWEDERDEMARRLESMVSEGLVTKPGPDVPLHFLDLRGAGPVWGPNTAGGRSGHVQTAGGITAAGRRLRRTCEEAGAVLLIVDSLAGAYAGDENTRALVRAFCADWDAWATLNGCTVMLIAHPSKGNDGSVENDYSGSTDWHNAARWRWTLSKQGTGEKRRVKKTLRNGETKSVEVEVRAAALAISKSSYGRDDGVMFLESKGLGWVSIDRQKAASAAAAKMETVDPPKGNKAAQRKKGKGMNDGEAWNASNES